MPGGRRPRRLPRFAISRSVNSLRSLKSKPTLKRRTSQSCSRTPRTVTSSSETFALCMLDARDAQYFGSDQMKAALGRNGGFNQLNIRIVDDPSVADVVLKVGYTFAWDYPFELRHQNTTLVLLAGKGQGPFSGPLGAADVARELVNAAKPYRVAAKPSK